MRRVLATLLLIVAVSANAGELQRAEADVTSLATAPLHWKRSEWKRFGEGVAAVAVIAIADRPLINAVQRNRNRFSNQFSRNVTPLGGHDALLASLALLGGGLLAHNDNVTGAGRDSLESQLWAAGVITPLIKLAVGRARPNANLGTHSFHPGNKNYQSFPSGHATNAFAAATAIAGHYDNWIVPAIVYAIASGVAVSRVHDNVHFPSDVLAGALIGRAVAKGVLARHRVSIVPARHGVLIGIH